MRVLGLRALFALVPGATTSEADLSTTFCSIVRIGNLPRAVIDLAGMSFDHSLMGPDSVYSHNRPNFMYLGLNCGAPEGVQVAPFLKFTERERGIVIEMRTDQ